MKKSVILPAFLLLSGSGWSQPSQWETQWETECQTQGETQEKTQEQPESQDEDSDVHYCYERRSPYKLPGERAWPYDAELETPTVWPGKREDSFYDWLTH